MLGRGANGWELFWKKPVKRRVQSRADCPISEGTGLSVTGVQRVLVGSLPGQDLERVFVLRLPGTAGSQVLPGTGGIL